MSAAEPAIRIRQPLDILIRGGLVVDGSGSPSYRADVAVRGNRIVGIGRFPGAQAERTIEAAGKVVSPGFIDPHSHSELAMLQGQHTAGVQMGVTTEFTAPDGFGYALLPPERLAEYRLYQSGIYGDADVGWDWRSFSEYLDRFEGRVYNNVVPMVPHGAVRLAVMGWAAGSASDAQLLAMRSLVTEAMETGAAGICTGLDYAPAAHSDTRELVELTKVAARYGGVYATHMRGYDDLGRGASLREITTIAEQAGTGVHINHFFGNPQIYAEVEAIRRKGVDITFDTYPYPAGATLLTFVFPRTLIQEPPTAFLAKIDTPAVRQAVRDALEAKLGENNPAYFAYLSLPENKWMEGKRVREAWRLSCPDLPFDRFVTDLLVAERLAPLLVYPWGELPESHEARLKYSLTHPLQMLITDGIYVGGAAHPRGWGAYPRLLGEIVRERGWLTLEDAVRRVTSFPAARFGLADRGLVKAGLAADLVVFDPQTVRDRATWVEPRLAPVGIEHVLVNGRPVVTDGRLETHTYAGQVLRHNGQR